VTYTCHIYVTYMSINATWSTRMCCTDLLSIPHLSLVLIQAIQAVQCLPGSSLLLPSGKAGVTSCRCGILGTGSWHPRPCCCSPAGCPGGFSLSTPHYNCFEALCGIRNTQWFCLWRHCSCLCQWLQQHQPGPRTACHTYASDMWLLVQH
jgi:hypothetical protein